MKTIALVGPLDTKGEEFLYLKRCIEKREMQTCVVGLETVGKPYFEPDISAEEVAAAAGTTIDALLKENDRAKCVSLMGQGAADIVTMLHSQKKIQGVISMGGSQTTCMAAAVMKRLPAGVPKVLVSTIATAEHDQKQFEGIQDTFVINPLVDVSGLNTVMKMIIERAAGAVTGMADMLPEEDTGALALGDGRECIAVSMWGVTTPCVSCIAKHLEEHGYEVLIFHATGIGGQTMEHLIRQGIIKGVADVTLAEFGNPLIGGMYDYNPERLVSAGEVGIPQVIVPGGFDMIKHMMTVPLPDKFQGRKKYMHNNNLMFVRSNAQENILMGKKLAEKVNAAQGPAAVLFPMKGISAYDKEGGPLYDPGTDDILRKTLRENLGEHVRYEELNYHINDKEFAVRAAEIMLEQLKEGGRPLWQ